LLEIRMIEPVSAPGGDPHADRALARDVELDRPLLEVARPLVLRGLPLLVGTRLVGVEAPGHRRVAELVICGAFLLVGEHFVCRGHALERVFGLVIAGVDVRMMSARELAIRLPDCVD
jgi:hypothetical protein